jgi:hypothetical protein
LEYIKVRKNGEEILGILMGKNFPKLKAQRTPNRINSKMPAHRHFIYKPKTKRKS